MTPTLKEITSFMGKGSSVRGANLRNKKPIIPKNVNAKKFLKLLKINQVEKESLKNRFTLDWCNYVSSHKERKAKIDFPKGILACEEKLSIGLRGVQPYAPLRVMHQLARVQEILANDDMSRFVFDTPPDFAFDSTDILKIWFGSIISELNEMVVEQDKEKVVPGYLSWFRDPVTFGDIPEGSNRKRNDQHIIRQLEKELEKAKVISARQEIQVQRERNHQLELQDIKREQSFEISQLKRDLVASEEVLNYQKGELKRQEEKFEQERSCWMRLHDQINAQLEEHKRKISHCVDIEKGQRQMIIERATLRHQLEAAEEQEALLRNNLEVAEQARAIVPHLLKVLLNLYGTLAGQRKPKEDDED
ncbi:hypothetical protein KY290_013757 [Solanum tuberosum]|uniref:Uncharacterized protein n=1 Tax=Solanum tuberosum TaxID=4113 RepID=A0ABQ7VMN0_SOLTU|nr:hypothetical protein KY289_015534 [Solanum tuberosum]KAH0769776.1 hypothetical protein KY290_013757 [Solanum tuberosum]